MDRRRHGRSTSRHEADPSDSARSRSERGRSFRRPGWFALCLALIAPLLVWAGQSPAQAFLWAWDPCERPQEQRTFVPDLTRASTPGIHGFSLCTDGTVVRVGRPHLTTVPPAKPRYDAIALTDDGRGLIAVDRRGRLHTVGEVDIDPAIAGRSVRKARIDGVAREIVMTHSGQGFLVLSTRGLTSFGDAPRADLTGRGLIDVTLTTTDRGFWVLNGRGLIRARGDARTHMPSGITRMRLPAARSLATDAAGRGFWAIDHRGWGHSVGDRSLPDLELDDCVGLLPDSSVKHVEQSRTTDHLARLWAVTDRGAVCAYGHPE